MTTTEKLAIEKQVLIDAPVEAVFAYHSDPENLPEIWPSLIEVTDVERSPDGQVESFGWVYKMAGVRFNGHAEFTAYEQDSRTVVETRGGIRGRMETIFEPEGSQTRVIDRTDYHIPIPLLGKVVERFLASSNENETELILANLKARMESAR